MIGNLARRSEQTENKAMEQTDARCRRDSRSLAFADHMDRFVAGERGDREKPGAERAAKLILVYYVPPKRCHGGIPRWAPKQKQSSLAPGFSWSPYNRDREKPGARLDCFCFGAHRGIQRDSGSWGHSRARSAPPPSLAPGLSRSPMRILREADLTLGSGTNNYLAYINIGRLFDRERNGAGNRIRRDCHLVHGVDDLSLHLRIC